MKVLEGYFHCAVVGLALHEGVVYYVLEGATFLVGELEAHAEHVDEDTGVPVLEDTLELETEVVISLLFVMPFM